MSKVKIVSDPYRRHTEFQASNGEWVAISDENNPNSRLHAKRYTEGFFPFKAREIVDLLLEEYSDSNEMLDLLFEGPDDEWQELVDVCKSEELQNRVNLERSERGLANARDILPFIRDVFDEVYPIIASQADGSKETQEQLRKFRDASSDVVPIVVVGNYSAGKSSFINSLIGVELLPSGDRPVTARIFRIDRSDQADRATIKFKYADETIYISFSPTNTKIDPPGFKGRLFEDLDTALLSAQNETLIARVRVVLNVLNNYKESDDEPALSNLIEVKVPFGADVAWGHGRQIVVFDTPGSNSSSNLEHAKVLEEAMRGMSDGLPIFVTCYENLDSNDNADLYDMISNMPALDERFAMIVVNKADQADLPREGFSASDADWVLHTVIAKNLYAQGIFFVSSIAGLGAKTGGVFSDGHYRKIFRFLRDMYEDADDEDYTQLYTFDIMPEQLQKRMAQASSDCPNAVLANSGLYSVELGIDEFATKYSAYNKCFQSDALLHELIEQTDASLEKAGEARLQSLELLNEDLNSNKEKLLDELLKLARDARENAIAGYLPSMNEWAKESIKESELTPEMLKVWESDLIVKKQREMGAEEKKSDAKSKRAAVTANLASRVQDVWDTKNMLGFTAVIRKYWDDRGAAREAEAASEAVLHGADREASNALLAEIRQHFDGDVSRLSREAEEYSKKYWSERSAEIKEHLLELVSNGGEIDEEKREALRQVILRYQDLTLTEEEQEIWEVRNPFDPNRLLKAPLRIQYNMQLSQRLATWRGVVEPAHERMFREWLSELVVELEDNLVDINPELRKKLASVRSTEEEIEQLKSKRDRLRQAERQVSTFMMWQEA